MLFGDAARSIYTFERPYLNPKLLVDGALDPLDHALVEDVVCGGEQGARGLVAVDVD